MASNFFFFVDFFLSLFAVVFFCCVVDVGGNIVSERRWGLRDDEVGVELGVRGQDR